MLSASARLPANAASSAATRRFVTDQLDQWTFPRPYDDVLIVVGELVSNAVRHVGGTLSVRLTVSGGCLRIEVGDDSSAEPEPRTPGPDGGFGLLIVERICARWGVDRKGDGKVVWCDCPFSGPPFD